MSAPRSYRIVFTFVRGNELGKKHEAFLSRLIIF